MKIKKINSLYLLLFLFILILVKPNSHAINNNERGINYTINLEYSGERLENQEISIYRIGEFTKDNKLILDDFYKNYPIDLSDIKIRNVNEYVNLFTGYILKDKIDPTYIDKTDNNGNINLKLKRGLYLIRSEDLKKDGFIYRINPYLINLPEIDPKDLKEIYNTISFPKISKDRISDKKINIDLLKIWEDKEYEDKRPNNVEIDLLEDGKIKDTISLSQKNNWTYSWNNLKSTSTYNIVEKNIDKKVYKVKIQRENNLFTLTNTYIHPKLDKEKGEKIPYTGQLLWPIYLLSLLGIIFIIIGFLNERMRKKWKINAKKLLLCF